MDKRGIVVAQKFLRVEGGVHPVALSGQELRKYLFFWDEIDYPTIRFLMGDTNRSQDLDFLESAGVLKRTLTDDMNIKYARPLPHSGKPVVMDVFGMLATKAQLDVYDKYRKKKNEIWTLGQMLTDELIPEGENRLGIDFDLYNVVAVPDKTVPLNDILDFKEKRRAELLAFWGYIDEVYRSVISSPDLPSLNFHGEEFA